MIDRQIVFQHDGSTVAPAYKTAVNTTGLAFIPPQPASIDFDANPLLVNNTLWISQGETLLLSSKELGAVHPGADDSLLVFQITSLQHGRFSVVGSPSMEINNFYQQNITDRQIQFTHDNSTQPPFYNVSVTDGRISLPLYSVQVVFNPPVLVHNQLTINQGQALILTVENLQATQMAADSEQLWFIISQVIHGNFSLTNSSTTPISRFQQRSITAGQVQFAHDETTESPGYRVSVTDGQITTDPQPASIDFDSLPVLVNNQIIIGQNQTILLTPQQLSAIHRGIADPNLQFEITNVTHATFRVMPSLQWLSQINLTQQAITNGSVFLRQDGSSETPSYQVVVTDGRAFTSPASGQYYILPATDVYSKSIICQQFRRFDYFNRR